MTKQYNVTVNGTTYEVTVESAGAARGGAPVARAGTRNVETSSETRFARAVF